MIETAEALGACPEALEWLRGQKSPEDAWESCVRGDWMVWSAMRMAGQPGWAPWPDVVLVLCDILEPLCAADPVALRTIQTTRLYAMGEIPIASLHRAVDASDVTCATADTAYAAYANCAAAYAADATFAATFAANAAANTICAICATTCTADAANAAANAICAICATDAANAADIVRERIPFGGL